MHVGASKRKKRRMIPHRQNCPSLKKSLEPKTYFGDNWSRISQIEMKLLGFIHSKEGYICSKEGHWPIMLRFSKKYKLHVSEDQG
jgi:hypothetical protein